MFFILYLLIIIFLIKKDFKEYFIEIKNKEIQQVGKVKKKIEDKKHVFKSLDVNQPIHKEIPIDITLKNEIKEYTLQYKGVYSKEAIKKSLVLANIDKKLVDEVVEKYY